MSQSETVRNSAAFSLTTDRMTERPQTAGAPPTNITKPPDLAITIESVLLGLILRGRLTTSEENQFNRLASGQQTLFLYHDEHIHPGRMDSESLRELIATVRKTPGSAVFSNHQIQSCPGECNSVACAGLLTPTEHEPAIFGQVIPRPAARTGGREAAFADLLESFRRGYRNIQTAAAALRERLVSPDSIMIIHRTTGRILAANNRAQSLLEMTEQELVDHEFNEISRTSLKTTPSHTIRMERRLIGSVPVALVVIREKRTDAEDDSGMRDALIHQIRNKIAALVSGTSLLAKSGGLLTDERELAQKLAEEAMRIEVCLRKLRLIQDPAPRDRKQSNN